MKIQYPRSVFRSGKESECKTEKHKASYLVKSIFNFKIMRHLFGILAPPWREGLQPHRIKIHESCTVTEKVVLERKYEMQSVHLFTWGLHVHVTERI